MSSLCRPLEVLLGNYYQKVDIWSAGVLPHALLLGSLPFKGDSLGEAFDTIKCARLDFHSGIWKSVFKTARDLIARILTRNVSARITVEEVLRSARLLCYLPSRIRGTTLLLLLSSLLDLILFGVRSSLSPWSVDSLSFNSEEDLSLQPHGGHQATVLVKPEVLTPSIKLSDPLTN